MRLNRQGIKMKRLFLFIATMAATLSLSINSQAKDDTVGDGAGLAEMRFAFAYNNLERFLHFCLVSNNCRLNARERVLAGMIGQALPAERQNTKQLQFKTQKEEDFNIGGRLVVAKTGSTVGSPIIINKDMIYSKDVDDQTQAMSEAEAVAVLVHEMGHHHGEKDEDMLDSLGVKVQALSQTRMQRAEKGYLLSNLVVSAFNFGTWDSFALLNVSDGEKVADLSRFVAGAVRCGYGSRLTGTNIANLHWFPGAKQVPGRPNFWILQMRAQAVGFCMAGNQPARPFPRARLIINLVFERRGDRVLYVSDSAYSDREW